MIDLDIDATSFMCLAEDMPISTIREMKFLWISSEETQQ